jgi:hypothetical protein
MLTANERHVPCLKRHVLLSYFQQRIHSLFKLLLFAQRCGNQLLDILRNAVRITVVLATFGKRPYVRLSERLQVNEAHFVICRSVFAAFTLLVDFKLLPGVVVVQFVDKIGGRFLPERTKFEEVSGNGREVMRSPPFRWRCFRIGGLLRHRR